MHCLPSARMLRRMLVLPMQQMSALRSQVLPRLMAHQVLVLIALVPAVLLRLVLLRLAVEPPQREVA